MNTPSIYHLLLKQHWRFNKLVVAAISMLIILRYYTSLNTRLGFALRATEIMVMVRAADHDSNQMKILGLALANGLVAASGAMIAQYQSYADAGMGVGMVVIGLASVIIGEVIFGVKPLWRRLLAVVLGSILYRLIIAFALGRGMPATDLKLVSAVIVAVALSAGSFKDGLRKQLSRLPYFQKRVLYHD